MKGLYAPLSTLLRGDDTLKSLVGYTTKKDNIRRGYQQPAELKDGKWKKLVVFYLQAELNKTDFTSKIRDIPLIIRGYDRDSDLNCDDIVERVIDLVDGVDLSVSGIVHCYDCSYQDEIIPATWNNDLESYEKAVRFVIVARKDG